MTRTIVTEQACTRCKKVQLLENFSPSLNGKYGRQTYCKACYRELFYERYPARHIDEPDLPNEIWKICIENSAYAVSNMGRVKRIEPLQGNRHTGHLITPIQTTNGYLTVALVYALGQSQRYPIHRLVCRAFHGEPFPHQTDVNHLDHDRTNNRAENLEWMTRSENLQWAKKHGRNNRGAVNGRSKLTENDALQIIHLLKTTNLKHQTIADRFGVTDGTVQSINRGRRWCYLLEGEIFPLQQS